jgi:glycolate oxidase FAD binding subunit
VKSNVAVRTPSLDALTESVQPTTVQEVAEVLASCAADGRAVVPFGGGQALSVGNPTRASAIALGTRGLDRIIDYQSTDMTLSVQAGVSLESVSAALAEHGQMLPIEAPFPASATIGGLLATALTGPRRYGGGSLRDVIIGITVAYADGSVGKAGGLVVKNVSGFDMMRIHYGALGTLGVITSANFKVLPLPRSEFTVLHPFANLHDSDSVLPRLRPPSLRPVALVLGRGSNGWTMAARFEGRESGLDAVISTLGGFVTVNDRLEEHASSEYWQQLMNSRAFTTQDEVRIQMACRPTEIVRATESALSIIEQAGVGQVRAEIEPGLGLSTLSLQAQQPFGPPHVAAIRAANPGTIVTVLAAPDACKSAFDVWGDPPETIELMRRLKNEFDPKRVLNPGRFAGMI